LSVVSSDGEMEAGLHQKLQDAAVDKHIVVHLDAHRDYGYRHNSYVKVPIAIGVVGRD